jgi:hypothetical protein
LKEYTGEEKTVRRDRQFAALQLAVVLERYAIECATRISEIDRRLNKGYETGFFAFTLPGMPKLTLPDAVEWRWIATDLTSEVLSLAPKISFSDGSIEFTLDIAGLHDGAEESQRQLGLIGYEAWLLASKVRSQHNLSTQAYALGQWNFENTLEKYAA